MVMRARCEGIHQKVDIAGRVEIAVNNRRGLAQTAATLTRSGYCRNEHTLGVNYVEVSEDTVR